MISRIFSLILILFISQLLLAENYPVLAIEVEGNIKTKDFVIKREMLVQPDSVYDDADKGNLKKLLKQSQFRILNLNLFNNVTITYTLANKNNRTGYVINVEVIEKWYTWPIPFIEFSDRNFNVWKELSFDPGRTNYGLYLFNYNLFGRNHTLKTSLVTGYNKTYGLEYRIPFISQKNNWGISTDIKYTSQEEMWLKTENDKLQFLKKGNTSLIQKTTGVFEFSNRFKPYTTISFKGRLQNTQLDSSIKTEAVDYLLHGQQNLSVFGVGISLKRDRRNNIYLPTEGSFVQPQLSYQYFNSTSAFVNLNASLKAQLFHKIAPKFYTAFSAFGEVNNAKELPYEYTRRLGYDNIIRGFESYVVDGQHAVLGNAAIRYHLVDKPHINLNFIPIENYNFLPLNIYLEYFVDAGYVSNANKLVTNDLPNTVLYSTGISLQSLFYNDRVLRLEYSLNSLKESGFFVHFKKAL